MQLLLLGTVWILTYSLAEIQYMLYDPLQSALGCTNAQLGLLLTIFGIGNVVGAPIGGWLSDRFDCRKMLAASLAGNGILCFIFAFRMTYGVALWVWAGLAVTALALAYPSHIKLVRCLGDSSGAGNLFGLNETFVGVASIILNGILLYIFARFTSDRLGMKAVVTIIGAASIVIAVVTWFAFRNVPIKDEPKADGSEEKVGLRDFVAVLKSPATWLQGLAIFSVYTCVVTMSYFTPYATAVMGMTVTFSGALSLIRSYGLRLVGAPLGSVLCNRLNSVCKGMIVICALGIISMLIFLFMPVGTPVAIVILMILVVGSIAFMGKGAYYAVAEELHVPAKHAATTVGVAAIIGFSPDLFHYALIGHWLDKYGNTGYTYAFTFQAIVMAIGIAAMLYALSYKKKLEAKKASEVRGAADATA